MALKLSLALATSFGWIIPNLLLFAARERPDVPLEPVRPVDQVKVADAHEGPLVCSPLTARNTRFWSVGERGRCQPRGRNVTHLTRPSFGAPSSFLMMLCDGRNTDIRVGSKEAP